MTDRISFQLRESLRPLRLCVCFREFRSPRRGLGIFWPLNPQLKQRAIFGRLSQALICVNLRLDTSPSALIIVSKCAAPHPASGHLLPKAEKDFSPVEAEREFLEKGSGLAIDAFHRLFPNRSIFSSNFSNRARILSSSFMTFSCFAPRK